MYLCIPKKAAHRVLAAVLCAAASGGVLLGGQQRVKGDLHLGTALLVVVLGP